MILIALVSLFVLVIVGVVFYFFHYGGDDSISEGNCQRGEGLLSEAATLTPALKEYLFRMDYPQLVQILAANAEQLAPSLLEEIAGELVNQNLSGQISSLVRDPSAEVRVQAVEVLGYIEIPGVTEVLVEALGDKSEAVRLAAVASLIRLQDPSTAVPLAKALANPANLLPARVAEVLLALGGKSVQPLIDEIKSAGQEGQPLICEVLGQIGDPGALPVLREILKDSPYNRGRAAAAQALGSFQGEENVRTLTEALKDPAWEVRARAAEALGQLGNQEAVQALTAASKDENWNVQAVVQAALNKLNPAAGK